LSRKEVGLTLFQDNFYNLILCRWSLRMKIRIPDIPKEGLDLELEEAIEIENVSTPIRARVRIEKLDTEVLVKGDLKAQLKFQCSRCLKDFHRDYSVPVDAVYHPVEELKEEEYHEVTSEELDTDFYRGEELDLLSLLKEQIMLVMPMKPLCAEACKGICPVCGTDLNVDTCACSFKKVDPRFEGLKKLLNQ
jgi:uncharacterized protein